MEIHARVGNATERPLPDTRPGALVVSVGDGTRALALIVLAVFVFQLLQGLNGDTSWLLSVGERWLDGAKPYVQVLETNPPMSVLMFLPEVWLGRVLDVRPETLVILATALTALGAIEFCVHRLNAAGLVMEPARLRLALGFAALILPMSTFAEREHIAFLTLMPLGALTLLRAEGARPTMSTILIAGIGAGLTICIKPQFAAAVVLPALIVARSRRNFAEIFAPEYWLAGVIVAAYAAMTLLLFPGYREVMLPLVMDLYRPVKEPLSVILSADVMPWIGAMLIGLYVVARGQCTTPAITLPLMMALGFGIAVAEQSKGWAYHYYPVVAALVPALLDRGVALANERLTATKDRTDRLFVVCGFVIAGLGLTFGTLTFLGTNKPMQGLMAPIAEVSGRPSMAVISPHFWIGNPLVRDVGGRTVSTVPSNWMTAGALYKLGLGTADETERKRLNRLIDFDKSLMADDIRIQRPDLVVVEHDDRVFPAWFGTNGAELPDYLAGYRLKTTYLGIDLWVRSDR